jgi:hypothetical protein
MRRRPVAVYRVIDEEELLGGAAVDELDDACEIPPTTGSLATIAPVRQSSLRERFSAWSAWGSTALGVAALACVALLLLRGSAHVRVPAPPRRVASRAHASTAPEHSVAAAAPVRRAAPRRRAAPVGPARQVVAPRSRHTVVDMVVHGLPRGSAPATPPTRVAASRPQSEAVAPAPRRAPAAPAREFGFER